MLNAHVSKNISNRAKEVTLNQWSIYIVTKENKKRVDYVIYFVR